MTERAMWLAVLLGWLMIAFIVGFWKVSLITAALIIMTILMVLRTKSDGPMY